MTDAEIEQAQLIRVYILDNLLPWAFERGISPNVIAMSLSAIGKIAVMTLEQKLVK